MRDMARNRNRVLRKGDVMRCVGWIMLALGIVCIMSGCMGMKREDVALMVKLRNDWINMGVERAESLKELYASRDAVWEQLKAQKKEIQTRLEAGEIPIEQAKQLIAFVEREAEFTRKQIIDQIEQTKDDFDERLAATDKQIEDLKKKGYKWWQILGAFVGGVGGGIVADRKRNVLGFS